MLKLSSYPVFHYGRTVFAQGELHHSFGELGETKSREILRGEGRI